MKETELQQYLIINKEVDISKGKLGVQTAHASARFERAVAKELSIPLFDSILYQEWAKGNEKKIAVRGKLSLMEKLESEGWISVRDSGLNEVEANTLTVVISPPMDKKDAPKWIQRLQVYTD